MGGAVSRGIDNDDLVDNLKNDEYIVTESVERAFRLVDRGDFFLVEDRDGAYEDHAWRNGTLHMSAPCIYTKAVEALQFRRGLSFLNLGSGTGYLSTLVGTLVGPHGTNHGIEIHERNVRYAEERVREFTRTAPTFDLTSFCTPKFVVGNCLFVNAAFRLYDRVYCGAACPEEYIDFLKSLLCVGGILVVPFENQLQRIERVSQDEYKIENVLSVSFADLIIPRKEEKKLTASIEITSEPISLQDLCRLAIHSSVGESRLSRLAELPLPQSILPYLRCYRDDEAVQRKLMEKREAAERMKKMLSRQLPKKRRKTGDEEDEGEEEDGENDENDDDNDDDDDETVSPMNLPFGGPLFIRLDQLGGLGFVGSATPFAVQTMPIAPPSGQPEMEIPENE